MDHLPAERVTGGCLLSPVRLLPYSYCNIYALVYKLAVAFSTPPLRRGMAYFCWYLRGVRSTWLAGSGALLASSRTLRTT